MNLEVMNPTLYTEIAVRQLTKRFEALNAARNTVWKEPIDKEPSDKWWKSILLAEHSPIRVVNYEVKVIGIPYWVSVHFCRHKVGVEHFVSTQRGDRIGGDRDLAPQGAPVNHTMVLNAQAMITISRKRLCRCASKETQFIWSGVIQSLSTVDKTLSSVCVPECVYRGFCPEMKSCGYSESTKYNTSRSLLVGG